MNLALEKGERVTTGGKGRGEIGGEAGEVTGVVADAPTTNIYSLLIDKDGRACRNISIQFPCVCPSDLFNFW